MGQAGREGESYEVALKLSEHLEREIAEAELVEWERLARAEREAREARVAATRQRAAKELPSEIRAMEFVRIPAGRFQMGSEFVYDGIPVHQVRVSRTFELGKYEVMQSEWTAVMGQNPSIEPCQRCPVTNVSWNDIQEFIGILNQAVGQGSPYRLPTEAEWSTPRGRVRLARRMPPMLMRSRGMAATVAVGHTRLARKRLTHLVYTTFWETFGNGYRIGTGTIQEGE